MTYDKYGYYYDDYDDYEDKGIQVDHTTDTFQYDAIGGVGQLIYHLFRFKEYELDYSPSGMLIARPYCMNGYEPELYTNESPSGAELTASIYNLAKKINDPSEERSYTDLIVEWCKKYGHPYAIDSIHAYLTDPQYRIEEDGFFIERDGTFGIDDFMRDLERFYQAIRLHFAFEQMCIDNDEPALTLYEDGRHFEGLPFFEQYKYDPDRAPKVDYSSAGGDLLKEMQMDIAAAKGRTYYDDFARVPFDYYEDLQKKIADMIPDFSIRLKIDPRTRKMVFAADIHSVFDICWLTFAKKLAEGPTPEEMSHNPAPKTAPKGLVMSCPFCGEAYVRTANRSITCGKPECTRARKRLNKQNSRKKQKVTAHQSK